MTTISEAKKITHEPPNSQDKSSVLPRAQFKSCYQHIIAQYEKVGIEHYLAGRTTYEAILNGASRAPNKTAITYMLDGSCYDPKKIPFKVKITNQAVSLLKNQHFARPYHSVTFKELAQGVNQTANCLYDLGVDKGDVVSLLLPNFIETHFALWGAEAAGIANPINPLLEADVIKDILIAANTTILIALGPVPGNDIWSKVQKIKDSVPSLKKVLVLFGKSDTSENILNFEKSIQKYPSDGLTNKRQIQPDDTASMFHTGGTTGTPKLALHTHANEVANAAMLAIDNPVTDQDKALVGLPLFHVNAAIGTGLMPLSLGVPIVLAGPAGFRSPKVIENFFRIIEHHKISFFSAVPTAYSSLLKVDSTDSDLSTLRFAISGAAPMPVETFKQFEQKTGVRLLEGYGLTEATCASSLTPFGDTPRIGSIGIRLPFSEMKVVHLDSAGQFDREAAINEVGTIIIRGPNVFTGYLKAEHNKDVWVSIGGEHWLNSGDLGRMDDEGYFWLTGRKKELIIRGGHNIDPKMTEEPLSALAGIEFVAAIGRPDSYSGEIPVAYVTLKNPHLTAETILLYAESHIQEKAAIPKTIHIIKEMPTTAVGKVFKPQLTWWQVEEVITSEMKKNLAKSLADQSSVLVRKHEKFGSLATITLSDHTDTSSINRLKKILDKYHFKYEIKFK